MQWTEDWVELGRLLEDAEGAVRLAELCLMVRSRSGELMPLRANAAQRMFERRRGRENIVLKARQMGVSTWVAGRFLLKTILRRGTTSLMVAHTRETAEMLFGAVTRMWENLPAELRSGVACRRRATLGLMTFEFSDSEFRVASAADANAGRGLSVQNLHCSEVARWGGDAAATLAGLRAALAPGGELVLESTPQGAYGCFYEQWLQAEEAGMVRHFFPWWMEPAYVGAPVAEATAEEAALMAREGLTAEQMGFRRELARRYGVLRAQEFAEDAVSCFVASGSCWFDTDAVSARLAELRRPVESRMGGRLLVWLPAVAGRRYVVGVDAAGGGSAGDFAAVQVIDEATGMQCAELQARMSPRELAEMVAGLAEEYNGALLAVERNNHGAVVLAHLEGYPWVHVYEGADGMPGWLTDVSSRPRMLRELAKVLRERPSLIASERLLMEMRSFVVNERGRAEGAAGAHDDLVMAMALALVVRGS